MNEALFREMNERVEERTHETSRSSELTIVCECADVDCTERITLSIAEYNAARDDGAQFLVAPGHETRDVEEIVTRNERFELVRKRGFAGKVADALDDAEPETA
jgi:hypothetical protein